MSFSGKVKEELARNISSARHCQIAELTAFIGMCGTVVINSLTGAVSRFVQKTF